MGETILVVTEADVVEAGRLHHRSAILSRRTAIVIGAFTLVLMLFEGALFGFGADDLSIALWVVSAIAIIFPTFMYLMMLGIYIVITPRLAKRNFAENKALQREAECRWSKDELHLERPGNTSTIPWVDFLMFRDSKSVLLLYLSRGLYLPMPKRCFTTEHLAEIGDCLAISGVPRGKPRK